MDISFRDLQLSDQTVRGLNPSLDVWVTPPRGRLAGDGFLDLSFAPSPLLGPPSSMTISVNNAGIWSGALDNLGPDRRSLRIPLPRALLRTDINRVNLQFLLRLQDDDCRIADNAARYVTLFRDSYLRFEPAEADLAAPALQQFPLPFLAATGPATPINVVVPESAGREHLTAAAQFAARLGRNANIATPNLMLLTTLDATPTVLAEGHVVLVGTPDELPLFAELADELAIRWIAGGPGGWVSANGLEVDLNDGLVAVGRSPWNRSRGLLAITGATPEAITKAGAALAAGTVGGVATGTVAVVPQLPARPATPGPLGGSLAFTLGDLGHQSTTFGGQGSHGFGVTFTAGMPDPAKPATIDVLTIHSGIMDLERSSMAVSMNGTSVGSSLLDAGSSGFGRFHLNLPPGIIRPGVNNLSLDFTSYLPQQSDCGPLAEERAWVSLLSTSSVNIPQLTGPVLDLGAYPYPFVHNRTINNVALLLPDAPAEREVALGVAAELGRWAQQDASGLMAGGRGEFTDADLKDRNLVVFGTPANSPGASLVTSLLDRTRPLERLGLIALARSPWRQDRAMLVISGAGPDLLAPATNALALGRLSGTALYVAQDGRPIPVPAAVELEVAAAAGATRPALSPILVAAIVVGALTLGAVLLGFFRREL